MGLSKISKNFLQLEDDDEEIDSTSTIRSNTQSMPPIKDENSINSTISRSSDRPEKDKNNKKIENRDKSEEEKEQTKLKRKNEIEELKNLIKNIEAKYDVLKDQFSALQSSFSIQQSKQIPIQIQDNPTFLDMFLKFDTNKLFAWISQQDPSNFVTGQASIIRQVNKYHKSTTFLAFIDLIRTYLRNESNS
jgi:phosphoenolpyruvate synthase/pyruvate phosphate dikinase